MNKNYFLPNFSYFLIKIFPILIIFFSTITFLFIKKDFSAFEPSTLSFIPGLEFLNSDHQLDYYTKSIIESPRIIILHVVNYIFSDWSYGTYFLKVLINLSINVSIWFLFISVIKHNLKYDNITFDYKISLLTVFLFIIFISEIIKKFHGPGSANSPLGWGGIQYFQDFNQMILSFIFGIYGIINVLKKDKILNLISIVIILLSTLIHPVMGICNFILLILFFRKKFDYNYIKDISIFIFLAILIPVIILKIHSPSDAALSGREFFEIYVFERHPHHYMISDKIFKTFHPNGLINYKCFLLWSFFFSLSLVFSLKFTKKIFSLNLMIFLIFHLLPIIQYFTVEVFYLKVFIQLGINRFSSMISIIFFIQSTLNLVYFLKNYKKTNHNLFVYQNHWKFFTQLNFIIIITITLFITNKTYTHPMDDKRFISYHQITKWVEKNITDEKEILLIDDDDTYLSNFLRVFGKQKIFYDYNSFPFSEKYIKKYKNRQNHQKMIVNLIKNKNSEYIDDHIEKSIGYIISSNELNDLNVNFKEIIYKDKYYTVLKI